MKAPTCPLIHQFSLPVTRSRPLAMYTAVRPCHCTLVGCMLMPVRDKEPPAVLSLKHCLSPFLPHWTTFEPPQEFIRVLQRLASFLLSPIGTYRRAKGIVIFVFLDVSHSDNPQPAAANTAHNARHHALGRQIREGDLLLPSSGLRGNCNLLLLRIHDKPVV